MTNVEIIFDFSISMRYFHHHMSIHPLSEEAVMKFNSINGMVQT